MLNSPSTNSGIYRPEICRRWRIGQVEQDLSRAISCLRMDVGPLWIDQIRGHLDAINIIGNACKLQSHNLAGSRNLSGIDEKQVEVRQGQRNNRNRKLIRCDLPLRCSPERVGLHPYLGTA